MELWFKTDQTVNYRGWDINGLTLHSMDDAFLSTSEVTFIELPAIKFNFKRVFPNPSFGKINLDIQSWQGGPASVKIYNVLGQQVYGKRFESLARGNFFLNLDFNELNTATVSSGMLFVSVESKNQKVIRKCIVLKN